MACVRLENAFGMKLFKGKDESKYFIKFVIDGLLRGDTATPQQAYKTQLENGIITINEWRKLENLPPIDEPFANDHFVSQQLRPIKMAYLDNTKPKGESRKIKKMFSHCQFII